VRRPRPKLITALGGLSLVNAAAAAALGAATLGGSRLLFAPLGAGTGRVAPASLLGPWAPHVGWVLLALGAGAAVLGAGLLRLRPWARRALLAVAALAALATGGVTAWGAGRRDVGVVASGALKVALYLGLAAYLRSAGVRAAFRAPSA
jgi:hypothetical protein